MFSSIATAALIDIRCNIVLAEDFILDLDLAGFKPDRKSFYATTRALEIISEASRRLPEEVNVRHPHIAWQNMRSAGNRYRPDYDDVSPTLVWKTVKDSLPLSRIAVDVELAAVDRAASSLKDQDP